MEGRDRPVGGPRFGKLPEVTHPAGESWARLRILIRRPVIQTGVRLLRVVFPPPPFDFPPCVHKIHEYVRVQAFVP